MKNKLRFYNAMVLTAPNAAPFLGELHVEGGKILYVGKGENAPLFEAEREIDCERNLLMSGFCNAHAHAAMSLFRGIADDYTLEDWLYDCIFPLEKNLTAEDVYWGTMLQIAEFVRNGITCFADMYFFPESVVSAAKNANMGLALCCPSSSMSGGNILGEMERNYYLYSSMSDRIRCFIGLHAEYTCEESLLAGVADLAAETGSKTYIHLSETLKEVGDCTVRHGGLTPPQYLHKLGFFDNGGLAAHCVYVDKDDMELLRQSGVTPVVNCGSNLKLGSGIAPVASMLRLGMHPALGTDGTASNNASSMFREMYLYSCLQKQALKDASVVSAEEALRAATCDGYAALGLSGGKLENGTAADVILIDLRAVNLQPISDVCKNLVYSGNASNVVMTVCGGKIVYEKGTFSIGETLDKIFDECNRRQRRLMRQAEIKHR